MIEIPNTIGRRIDQYQALSSAYNPPERVSWWYRNRWLLAALAWAAFMFVCAFLVPAHPPRWLEGFSGNLVAGATISVLFVFVALHLGETQERALGLTNARVEALAAALFEYRLISTFEAHLDSGESADFLVYRPRSGPDTLLYHISAVMDPRTKKPLRFGRPSDRVFVILVTAPPLLANLPAHRDAYEKSAIKSGRHYFARFQDRSWHMGASMTSLEWFEFEWAGSSAEALPATTADEFVEELRRRTTT